MFRLLIRFILSIFLIIFDFILYTLPVLIICTIPTIILFIQYFPRNLFYLYYGILFNNYLGPNLKFIFSLFTPYIILIYFPTGLFISLFYTFQILLLNPIKQYYKKSNDALFTFSSTFALIYFIYHKLLRHDLEIINLNVENRWDKFSESPTAKPIFRSIEIVKTVWDYFYTEIPSMIHDYRTYKGERIDVNILRSFFSLIMVLICLIITIPTVILACIILYIPLVIRLVNKIWKKHLIYISLDNIFYATITLVFLILITIISPVIVLVGETGVVICVFMISLLEVWCVGLVSVKAGFEMIEWILIGVIGYCWNFFF
ncbi:hypothetical protein F8M41_005977 [Gigaspora margarita]|uniref:Uncharacterized protein n=1 Tax=Gigaspora margarita TaxID=4874 RepID=A0A8H3X9U7_GIGMA|nr:hypothetical protein F8M41_005977 [Gigaspora margarita]